jgi:putative pre-16S rRNA nuclease
VNAALARYLAVDYGRKRIGLAISDPLGMIATPAGFIERRAAKRPPITKIIARAEELEARGFVFGLPLDGEGHETEWTAEVRAVGVEIAKRTGLPIRFLDERFTTAAALRTVKEMGESTRGRKGDVDALAATILLQQALNVQG